MLAPLHLGELEADYYYYYYYIVVIIIIISSSSSRAGGDACGPLPEEAGHPRGIAQQRLCFVFARSIIIWMFCFNCVSRIRWIMSK